MFRVPVTFFNRALELDPTLAAAHRGLAMLFNREGTLLCLSSAPGSIAPLRG